MLSHIPNRPGEITLREMILAVKAISVLSWGTGLEVGSGKVIPKHKSLLSGLTDGGKRSHMQQ